VDAILVVVRRILVQVEWDHAKHYLLNFKNKKGQNMKMIWSFLFGAKIFCVGGKFMDFSSDIFYKKDRKRYILTGYD